MIQPGASAAKDRAPVNVPPLVYHDPTFLWADECWCAGEVLTTDGAYTKHKPIFGPLPGAS